MNQSQRTNPNTPSRATSSTSTPQAHQSQQRSSATSSSSRSNQSPQRRGQTSTASSSSASPHRRGPGQPIVTRQAFSDECKLQRVALIRDQRTVEAATVVQAALKKFNASSLEEINLNFNAIDELKAIKDLSRSTSTLIMCAAQSGAVVTIKDCVDIAVKFSDIPGATTFDDLGLGPAMQHREIRRAFSLDDLDESLRSISVPDRSGDQIIAKLVERFAMRRGGGDYTVDDFLKFLCDTYHVQHPLQLGVRINSFPLCIQSMGRALRSAKKQVNFDLFCFFRFFICCV